MNKLFKTKCTVIGPMQYADGTIIRNYFKQELGALGITVFDHYNNPFEGSLKEDPATYKHIKSLIEQEKYDEVAAFKSIRNHDLALIDRSDFIICHYVPGIQTCGTHEECFLANSCKKPIFYITEGGKKLTPIWMFWTLPHRYIYNNKEEVMNVIKKIDSGEIVADSDRWRLLAPEFR